VIIIFDFLKKQKLENNFSFFEFLEHSEKSETREKENLTVFEQMLLKQRRDSNSPYIKYISIAVTVIVVVALFIMGNYLSVFQKNVPNRLCERISESICNNNVDVLLDTCTNLPKVLKDKENLKEYLNSYLIEEVSFYEVSPDYKSEKKFIFKSGNKKIGEINFREDKETDLYGIKKYFIRKFDLYPLTEYKIYTVSLFDVKVNGEKIPDKYLFSKNKVTTVFEKFSGVEITKNLYVIKDLFYIADISGYDLDGEKCDIKYDSALSQYEITRSAGEYVDEISEFTADFVLKYLNYTLVNEGKAKDVLKYIHPKSVIYKNVEHYEIIEEDEYIEEKIENYVIKDMVYYGGGFYSCDIGADYVTVTEEDTVTFNWNKKLYLIRQNDRFYIIDVT